MSFKECGSSTLRRCPEVYSQWQRKDKQATVVPRFPRSGSEKRSMPGIRSISTQYVEYDRSAVGWGIEAISRHCKAHDFSKTFCVGLVTKKWRSFLSVTQF